ncbi:MAG: hypothetical protein ACYC7A_12420 [Thermoanaerobaculia bacterium]
MDAETRRAAGTYRFVNPTGRTSSGEGEAVITDDGLTIGDVAIAWLDADSVRAADWQIAIELWPAGSLTLTHLGRRFETFSAALHEARDAARVAGMLAHGIDAPGMFEGRVREPVDEDASLLLFATHVTAVPRNGDPFQVPFGAMTGIEFDESAWNVVMRSASATTCSVGMLGTGTQPFRRAVTELRDASARRMLEAAGRSGFADGMGVGERSIAGFRELVAQWTSPERADCVPGLLDKGGRGEARLGLVEMLDRDEDTLTSALPENIAAFLLIPFGKKTVLEIATGPAAATYVFASDIEAVNRDLQLLHFRRRALALSDAELTSASSDYRLAAHKLEPLKRLRAAIRARVVHDEGWTERVAAAV